MTAIVRPEKLREALNAKLSDVPQLIFELQQAEKPEFNRYTQPEKYATDILHAARGVFPVAKSFADAQPSVDFDAWYEAWRRGLTEVERSSWRQLRDDRVAHEHGEGAPLIQHMVEVTRGDGYTNFSNYAALGIRPPERGPSKGCVRYAAYPDQPASAVARDYLALAQRFVDDFLREHEHLLGATKGKQS